MERHSKNRTFNNDGTITEGVWVKDDSSTENINTKITPQSFESNDGRFRIEVEDDGCFELTMTDLASDEDGYYEEDTDYVQEFHFNAEDLDRLIEILTKAKEINPYNLDTYKKIINKGGVVWLSLNT